MNPLILNLIVVATLLTVWIHGGLFFRHNKAVGFHSVVTFVWLVILFHVINKY